ncbi:Ty3/gypsy retrotransposon protein [Cucumis melo var. makuwa]|uniref:Ty3/gypsy retrotransposon protein n=1 Tax=Cucumis melo var. makuwa TaxID=1194695 RepID=A0A5D3CT96_CUCMM|nr:Ty3/gypsy retrotransposon protein [Cucumis melo var. makuwa]
MAQRQMEERLEGTEKEVLSLKEMMLEMKKSMDRLADELRDQSYKKKEESGTSDGSIMKMKGKMEETDVTGEIHTHQIDRSKYKKLEMPMFLGENPESWVYRAEHFFEINNLPEAEKVKVAVVSFGQDEVDWYRWSHNRRKVESWEDLKTRMFEFFRDTGQKSLGARLIRIQQEGSYSDYVKKFVNYSAPLPHMAESVLRDAFLTGLEPALQAEVMSRHPQTLEDCMMAAQLVNDRNLALKLAQAEMGIIEPKRSESVGNKVQWNNEKGMLRKNEFQMKQITIPLKGSYQKGEPPVKRLSDAEFRARLDKGLCFRCNEKYSHGHRCKIKEKRELMLFILNEEESTEEGEGSEAPNTEPVEINQLGEPEETMIEYRAITSLTTKGTMKLRGIVKGKEVIVLIDSGATHNFIHHELVKERKIPINRNTQFGITIGDGTSCKGEGICSKVEIQLEGLRVVTDLLVVGLGTIDVVLGMQWLDTTGTMKIHWPSLTMVFWKEGNKVVLKGDPALIRAECSLKTLEKTWEAEDQGFLLDWQRYEIENEDADCKNTSHTGDEEGLPMIQFLLHQYSDVFESPTTLPPKRSIDHRILTLPGQKPINVRPYKYGHQQKEEIEKLVMEMLQTGIIRPSHSPFSSPVLLVKKKDGGWRFCVDYRKLNTITIADKFPIPVIEELLDELHGATVFSKLDLKSGYHQIRMREEDIEKTAFRTHEGHYEFVVMPFGLTNAPATFQALMNQVFKPFLRRCVLVFFDDILVYSSDITEHEKHLGMVFATLRDNQLYANRKKCVFAHSQIHYLGHVISKHGVEADQDKVKSMLQWPKPKDVTGLRGFLGLTGYYRRFVKGYGEIAAPLTKLLQKNAFKWDENATLAFENLKSAMSTIPVLALPDWSLPFMIETDASGSGLGAVLSQNSHPIAFFSQKLSTRAQAKSIYERELMAVVLSVQKWRHYLLGRRFTIMSDQKALKFLLEQREVQPQFQKWLTKLLGYDFEILYQPGLQNKAADALSRMDHSIELKALSTTGIVDMAVVTKEIEKDEELQLLIQQLQNNPALEGNYSLTNGTLMYKGRVVLSKSSSIIPSLLHTFHDSILGGHSGFLRTYKRMSGELFWKGMKEDIKKYVEQCEICQRNKSEATKPAGVLQPLPIPDRILEDWTMDFIEGLPKAGGMNVIMVVVDRLSKYAYFVTMKHPFSAKQVAMEFIDKIVRRHGIPKSIISDRDKIFVSNFWKELFYAMNTILKRSTAFHPQTDGQTERVNQCLETYLRCFCNEQPNKWHQFIPWAELWYNTTFHSSTRTTPFQTVYGRPPPPLISYGDKKTPNDEVEALLKERDLAISALKENLTIAQNRMKKFADSKRRELKFKVGDEVYLKLRPYRQRSLARKRAEKLAPKYYGPYRIIETIGEVAYRLDLPPEASIHNVFHISQLKLKLGNQHNVQIQQPQLTAEFELQLWPETVLGIRWSPELGANEWLVKWKGLPDSEATWESVYSMNQQFPSFHLEDKVILEPRGIVRPPIINVYKRRGKKGKLQDSKEERENGNEIVD